MLSPDLTHAKVKALATRLGASTSSLVDFDGSGPSAALATTDSGYFLASDGRSLGPAARWAAAKSLPTLNLFAEPEFAGDLARRNGLCNFGLDVKVWQFELATPVPTPAGENKTEPFGKIVEASASEPATPPPLSEAHLGYEAMMVAAGADPYICFGQLVAEVNGLEVARVVSNDGDVRLDVGVGQADRELQILVHANLSEAERLERAVSMVNEFRIAGSNHPLGRVARQRWLLASVVSNPKLLNLGSLSPLSPLRPRQSLLQTEPAAAAGFANPAGFVNSGELGDPNALPNVIVVCSIGADLDLLAEAADYRALVNPEAEVILVVPEQDVPLSVPDAAAVLDNVTVASVPLPWLDGQELN